MSIERLRNIAIVAHVDHGKTTLVDCLLKQSGTLNERTVLAERVMDSNDQEKERGITILAKNTAITWQGNRINIVDTPGHADFGGEVERVLSMVDSVLILDDAMDGPMPQTRFVTQKAFAMGFKPIVVVNKIDRPGARPDWVIDQVFDLFDKLGATNEQLDFPIVYASALHGYASLDDQARSGDMTPLYEAIMQHVSPPLRSLLPANGELLTWKVIEIVGSSTVSAGSASGVSSAQTVSEIDRSATPEMATMSPASASSVSMRSSPMKPRTCNTLACRFLPSRSTTLTGMLRRTLPRWMRPMPIRPTKLL